MNVDVAGRAISEKSFQHSKTKKKERRFETQSREKRLIIENFEIIKKIHYTRTKPTHLIIGTLDKHQPNFKNLSCLAISTTQ